MSTLPALVLSVAIVGLCLSTFQFAACVSLLWQGRTERPRDQLLLRTALSAVLIILATLLLRYLRDETAAPILLISIAIVLAIIQVSELTARFAVYIQGCRVWLIGAIIICSIIKLLFCVLFLATSRQEDVPNTEPRKTMLNVVLWLFIFEYSLMGLLTLTVLDQRKSASTEQNRGTKEANAILVWDTIVCLIITVAASTLLALCYSSIVGVTTCLSILALATYLQMLELIWLPLRKRIRITQKLEMIPLSSGLSSVMGNNAAFSA